TQKQSLNFTFRWFNESVTAPFAFQGASVPGFGEADDRTTFNYVVRHTYTITPNLGNSLLLAYARNNQPGVVPENNTISTQIDIKTNFGEIQQFSRPQYVELFERGLVIGNLIQNPQARVFENFQLQESVS